MTLLILVQARSRFSVILGILSLLATGCASTLPFEEPSLDVDKQWQAPKLMLDQASPQPSKITVSNDQINRQWWASLNEPLLARYVQRVSEVDFDVRDALLQLSRARAQAQEEHASRWPLFGSEFSARRNRSLNNDDQSQTRSTFGLGFTAAWELDFFGRLQREVDAAEARVQQDESAYQSAVLSAVTEVGRLYYRLRGLDKRKRITEQNAELLRQSFELIQARYKAGEATEFDLSRAQGEVQLIESRLPPLESNYNEALFDLALLLQKPVMELRQQFSNSKDLMTPPHHVPMGLPSDLLKRRPDIKGALYALKAATADEQVAEADRWPRFSLTGNVGTESRRFSDAFKLSQRRWSLAGLVDWTVFDFGARRARIDAAAAVKQQALVDYERHVRIAIRDTEKALTRYAFSQETLERLKAVVSSRRTSLKLATELFDAGEEDYLAVLDAERELTASEDALVVAEIDGVVNLIDLYSALGGGWSFDGEE